VNCRQALAYTRKVLEDSVIENSSLEGEILLRHTLGVDRAFLFANLDQELTTAQTKKIGELLDRRQSGEPSAYITGHKEFYGLDFKVDNRVLIPRPETELLVENAIAWCRQYKYSTIADIGTGSGCIAISLAKNLPEAMVYAVDYSSSALEVAKDNTALYNLQEHIKLVCGNLLEPLPALVDMIVTNLPYVTKDEVNSLFEPELALNGGPDGLDIIKELIAQVPGKLKPKGALLLEVGQGQSPEVKANLHKAFPEAVIEVFQDLAGIERVVAMRLTA
jgi:release factor glutamine methyltransferase